MVLALFFCSGATALIYEVVWSKFLSQMFGSTIYAQTVVMAVFMGGLALGNRLFGQWANRSQEPVRAYGVLEAIIGIYALFFPLADRAVDSIFVTLGSPIIEHTGLLLVLKGILSGLLLLGPTVLMGGTLPLLAAWLQRSSVDGGRGSAVFYSINSLGAVAGAALAGFYLVEFHGLVGTLRITAITNLAIGVLAAVLSRIDLSQRAKTAPATDSIRMPRSKLLRWAAIMVTLSGAVSMGLEVLSARSLALIFGSSVQTFAVVLIAFILGIGLGSAWIASPIRSGSSERKIVVLLCAAAAWIVILVFNIERWTDFYRIVHTGLARNSTGYVLHELFAIGMAMVIIGLPAAFIGAVLPLMIRTVSDEVGSLSTRVSVLLTWNTLGAVAGTLLTGFVLMPQAGLRNAFGILGIILGVAALVVAWQRRWFAGMTGAAGVCVLTGFLFFSGNEGWRQVMSSGIFRIRETTFDPALMGAIKAHMKIPFYEDAPDATVSVEESDGFFVPTSLTLTVNGKPDAGTRMDMGTQILVSHLPMLARPGAKNVFLLGVGSGVSAGALLGYPADRIDVAENCEPVIHAARLFGDWNHHVLDNPRVHVWREDARTVLKLRPEHYDVIIAEPSNPWTVGVGSIFSQQFYELAASRLKTGGIVAQWFHLYEMQDDIVRLVLRTFSSVFPYVEIWDAGNNDIILLGSQSPWQTGANVFREGFAYERVRNDLWMIDIQSPEALMGKQLASQQTGFAIAGDGPTQTDLSPILEYAAPRAFYIGNNSQMLNGYDERTRQQLLAPTAKRKTLGSLPLVKAQLAFSTFTTVNAELHSAVFGLPAGRNVPCAFQTQTPASPALPDHSPLEDAKTAFAAGDIEGAARFAAVALNQNPKDAQAIYAARVIEREKETALRKVAVKTN
jgi:spermidine synthase